MRTVRGKLLFIVGLCLGPLLLATLVLSLAMEREERDDAAARVSTAKLAFASELSDDVADLRVATRLFASDPDAVEASCGVVASSGSSAAAGSLAGQPLCDEALVGRTQEGLAQLPLPGEGRASLVYARAQPIDRDGRRAGAVLAAIRLDGELLEGLRRKSDDAFALEQDSAVVAQSSRGPASWAAKGAGSAGTSSLRLDGMAERTEPDGRVFALLRFEPDAFRPGPAGAREAGAFAAPALPAGTHTAAARDVPRVTVLAARDISELSRDHRRFLVYRLAALLAIAALAVAVALFLAARMSSSVAALGEVLPGVAQRRYLPARVVPTGDELQRLAETYNAMIARLREGDLWRRALGKYLSRAALEAVKKGELQLGGTLLQSTVLFSDIRGFTALAEGRDPVQVLGVLNRYFTEMVGAVLGNRGIVDKFIGDAIMAVWGPPTPSPSDALDAVRAALEMRERLTRLNEQFERQGLPAIRTGIGIHSGPVVAGNMGAEGAEEAGEPGEDAQAGKMEYTVIGDAVNVAARLESLTKELQAEVLLSEETFAQVKDRVRAERLRSVQVKGRVQPVMVYRLIGLSEPAAATA